MYSKGFQEPCHGAGAPESKARLLHRARYATIMRLRERGLLTADERSFRNAKLEDAFLMSPTTVADLAGKGALFVTTIVAARRPSPEAF